MRNINLKIVSLVLVMTLGLLQNSRAAWSDDLFGREPMAGPCKEQGEVESLSIPELWLKADKLKENKKYCEAADHYLEIMINSLSSKEKSKAWYHRIESFFYKYDYEQFFSEVESFYNDRKESPQWEAIHFMLMRGMNELLSKSKTLDNPWLQFALGIHPEQISGDSIKKIYRFKSYLELFPNSFNAPLVRGYLEQARLHFNEDYLSQARLLVLKREYAPAIARYQFLLKEGPDLAAFSLVTYELLQVLLEFSYASLDERIVSSEKLARWLGVSPESIDKDKRLQVSQTLQDQGQKVLQMMITKLPNDPWTTKAKNEIGIPKP